MINTHQLLSGICSCLLISFLCKFFWRLDRENRSGIPTAQSWVVHLINLETKKGDCKTLHRGFEQSSLIASSSPKPMTTKSLIPLTKQQEISILSGLNKTPEITLALNVPQIHAWWKQLPSSNARKDLQKHRGVVGGSLSVQGAQPRPWRCVTVSWAAVHSFFSGTTSTFYALKLKRPNGGEFRIARLRSPVATETPGEQTPGVI